MYVRELSASCRRNIHCEIVDEKNMTKALKIIWLNSSGFRLTPNDSKHFCTSRRVFIFFFEYSIKTKLIEIILYCVKRIMFLSKQKSIENMKRQSIRTVYSLAKTNTDNWNFENSSAIFTFQNNSEPVQFPHCSTQGSGF